MEIKPLIQKLGIDFTKMYSNSKWVFFLFTVYWKKGDVVDVNYIQELKTVYFGFLGSFTETQMHVQIIIDPQYITYLVSWLENLLPKAERIVEYVNAWPANVELSILPVDCEYIEIFKGHKKNMSYDSSCDPFLLINDWLALLLEDENAIFFFFDFFNIYKFDVEYIHLMYSPLFYLKQKENFIHLTYKRSQRELYYFNCSFAEWWNYSCSPNTVIYHPTVYILNKISECGLYYIEFELDDDTVFFENVIRFGFTNRDIACSYTYQLPELYKSNRVNLIVGYRILDLEDIQTMQTYLLNQLKHLQPIQVHRYASKDIACLSYPNKVSQSIWTQDFRHCKFLCRRYNCEWDDLDFDQALSLIDIPKQPNCIFTETLIRLAVQQDVNYMREHKMDFIYVYRHHDPFTIQKKKV